MCVCACALPLVAECMRVVTYGSLLVVMISTIKWQKELLLGGA
jgi:hypothetical protein